MSLRAWLHRGTARRAAPMSGLDIGVTIFSLLRVLIDERDLGEPGESLRNLAGHVIRARAHTRGALVVSSRRTRKVIRESDR